MMNIASFLITNGLSSSLISIVSNTGYTIYKISKYFLNTKHQTVSNLLYDLNLDRKIKIIESTIPLIKNQYLEPVKLCVEGINDTLNRIYRDLDKIQHNYNIFTDKKKYIERVKKNSENLDRQFTDLLHLMNLKN